METSCEGIVIRTIPYSDHSIIARIYTDEFGLQSYILRGIRKKSGKSAVNYYSPLSQLKLTVQHKQGRGLQIIKEASFAYTERNIPFEVARTSVALFICEVLSEVLTEDHHPDESLYYFLSNTIQHLEHSAQLSDFPLQFMLGLSIRLGFAPEGKRTELTPAFHLGEGRFIRDVPEGTPMCVNGPVAEYISNVLNEGHVNIPHKVFRKQIMTTLNEYFRLHCKPGFSLNSTDVLEQIFS
jgi:DNA repair protein RecO (recombination protein O)